MKKLLLASAVCGLFAFAAAPAKIDTKPIPPKNMAYAKDSLGHILDSAVIDKKGNYHFEHLAVGTYTVLIHISGQDDTEIKGVEHAGVAFNYHYANANIAIRGTNFRDSDDPDDLPMSGSYEAVPVEIAVGSADMVKSPTAAKSGYTFAGSRKESGTISITGHMDAVLGKGSTVTPGLKAGQITAGNWRDLDNWDKWAETNKDANIAAFQSVWGFFPQQRFATKFLDHSGKPVIGAKVVLSDNFKTRHWETFTDNKGQAELFAFLNSEVTTMVVRDYKVTVYVGEKNYEYAVKPFKGSADVFSLPVNTNPQAAADIAFVVDATGSMGDEISYLQAEMLDVVTRVKKSNHCLDIRTGSVFYRDHGDAFLTVKSDLDNNLLNTVSFISELNAGGGGDFPEAVDAAMETSIDGLSWNENAIARIMFLVLDAPPHEDSASKAKMQKYTKLAAAKGIKIIPVTASGINQSTEFLMKYLAIATNGNYVYITDHSGIGNAHEKPTGVKENVQYLNDLLVDIINENTQWIGCKDSQNNTVQQQPGTVEILTNGQWQVQVYPNPAKDKLTVKSNETPDEISLYNLQGELVKKMDQIQPEKNTFDLGEIPTGIYVIHCRKGEQMVSCRILVMK